MRLREVVGTWTLLKQVSTAWVAAVSTDFSDPHDMGWQYACFRAEVGDAEGEVQAAAGRTRRGSGMCGAGAAGLAAHVVVLLWARRRGADNQAMEGIVPWRCRHSIGRCFSV